MQCFEVSYLNKKIGLFIQSERLYKEINFDTDIDKEKSGEYIIEKEFGQIRFICGNLKKPFNYEFTDRATR